METPTVKESSYKAGDLSSTPGMGRSPGDLDNPLHILAGESPWTEGPGGLQTMGSQSWTQLND